MDDIKSVLAEEFRDKEARRQYAAEFLYSHIALQIKTLRQQRKWSQAKLGKLAGKHQSQISAMERIDFSAWTISALLKLAEAFDLALTVTFESFGDFLDEVTSVSREELERPSFAEDPAFLPGRQAQVPAVASELEAPHAAQLRSSIASNVIYASFVDPKARSRQAGTGGRIKTRSVAQGTTFPMRPENEEHHG